MKPVLHCFKVMASLRRMPRGLYKSQKKASNYIKAFPETQVKENGLNWRVVMKVEREDMRKRKTIEPRVEDHRRLALTAEPPVEMRPRRKQFPQQLGGQMTLRGLASYSSIGLPRYLLEIQDFPQTS